MRILAFDPGYERLGVAVVEKDPSAGGKEKLLHSECVRTSAKLSFEKRLFEIGKAAEALIKTWRPAAVALEKVFFEKNAKTAMQVAEVCGVLAYIASTKGLVVHHYSPSEVKVAVTGHGASDKRAVNLMVRKILLAAGNPSTKLGAGKLDDELDAIAVGITCLASLR